MSKVIAFLPARGGSKSIPLKNIKPLAGQPLLYWATSAALSCKSIDEVYLSTDSEKIKQSVRELQLNCNIHHRQAQNALDHSSSESVLLEFIDDMKLAKDDTIVFLQVTSPFTTASHLTLALTQYRQSSVDSLLTVTESKRFFWNKDGTAMNYDYLKRPRRQEFEGLLMENGAFYISKVGDILKSKNRLSGKIGLFVMPQYTSLELDEPDDWIIAEQLIKNYS